MPCLGFRTSRSESIQLSKRRRLNADGVARTTKNRASEETRSDCQTVVAVSFPLGGIAVSGDTLRPALYGPVSACRALGFRTSRSELVLLLTVARFGRNNGQSGNDVGQYTTICGGVSRAAFMTNCRDANLLPSDSHPSPGQACTEVTRDGPPPSETFLTASVRRPGDW